VALETTTNKSVFVSGFLEKNRIDLVDQSPVQNGLRTDHGSITSLMSHSPFRTTEVFPGRHSMVNLEDQLVGVLGSECLECRIG